MWPLIEKTPDHEPINAKGKFIKRNRLDTGRAWTPEWISSKVEQVVKNQEQGGLSRKGVV